jgi:hypothetical protein
MASANRIKNILRDQLADIRGQIAASAEGGALGNIYYVDSGSTGAADNTTRGGTTPGSAFATIDYAIGRCSGNNGDMIYVMPGHAETVTAAITLDVAGVSIIGLGSGTGRPTISCATNSIDEMTVTAANCTIENLYFNESTGTTSRTSFINVAGAYCTIRNCHFDCGQYDLEQITVAAGGTNLTVEDCYFSVTADGPDSAIELEGASDDLIVRRCHFNGGSATNAWDAGAINSATACNRVTIEDNYFIYGKTGIPFIDLTAVDEPPVIRNNVMLPIGAAAGLANNYNGPANYYVDSRTGNNTTGAGHSWQVPCATIDYAVGLATSSNGDIIHVAAGHSETLTSAATLTVDKTGLTIKGYGNWNNRPTLTIDHAKGNTTSGQITVSKPSVVFDNLQIKAGSTSFALAKLIAVDEEYFEARNCLIQAPSGMKAFTLVELLTTKDHFRFINCDFESVTDPAGTDAAAMTGGIYVVDSEDIYLENCKFVGNFETSCIHNKTTACKNLWMKDCVMHCTLATAVPMTQVAGATGGAINCAMLASAATDVTEAKIAGAISSGFFFYDGGGGNDGAGGQQAVGVGNAT